MHMDQLDLNLLRLLDALLAERSVSRAAARVGLSQSAASNALRRLREHFEDPLLVRTAQDSPPFSEQFFGSFSLSGDEVAWGPRTRPSP